MIKSLKVVGDCCISWWDTLPALKDTEFEFKPGLNIIFGPNGSGKTTLLTLLAKMFHCYQGGIPKVTQESINQRSETKKGFKSDVIESIASAQIIHDAQPVHYFSPDTTPGLYGGMAAFDFDFLGGTEMSIFMAKKSSGQSTMMHMQRVIQSLSKNGSVEWKANLNRKSKEPWDINNQAVAKFLETATCDVGQKTILCDEPDRSLDMGNQILLWNIIEKIWSKKYQVIIAAHSPFSLLRFEANYIELVDGYKTECVLAIMNSLVQKAIDTYTVEMIKKFSNEWDVIEQKRHDKARKEFNENKTKEAKIEQEASKTTKKTTRKTFIK